jgi:hypothetical protein
MSPCNGEVSKRGSVLAVQTTGLEPELRCVIAVTRHGAPFCSVLFFRFIKFIIIIIIFLGGGVLNHASA